LATQFSDLPFIAITPNELCEPSGILLHLTGKNRVADRINIHHEATRFENTPNSRLFTVDLKVFQGE